MLLYLSLIFYCILEIDMYLLELMIENEDFMKLSFVILVC